MTSQRHLLICAISCVLLIGCGVAAGQPAPSGSPPFQQRIEELARTLQSYPRLKDLSQQQRIDRVEFVVGNTLFILLHEIGHVIMNDMNVPVLGREEDQADTFSAITMLKIGTSFSQRVLANASQGWFLNERRDQQTGAKPLYYDEHNLSPQRAYQIVCLMVGSDPAKFKNLADEAKMPESRQQSCKRDYTKASRSWETVLRPARRTPDQPETKINVVYGEAQGDLEIFARSFRAIRILETVAERSASEYAWPAPFTMQMLSCSGPNATWNDETRTLTVCYQLAFDFAQLYFAYVAAPPPAVPVSRKQKQKSK
ncbi:MAG TPA: DUF4344 domain-containing metallopeptidase [Xanthobacteraceae bacterium]|nr:DUF4344 domain-containing metallopeptidase [Xanthobacteraceae bacterium]